jgi:hypothetical protein
LATVNSHLYLDRFQHGGVTATARKKSPSPLFCSSSTSAILSPVIGSSMRLVGLGNSTSEHLSGDYPSLTPTRGSM